MKRRLKRKSKKKIVIITVCSIILLGVAVFLNFNYLNEIKQDYITKLDALTLEMTSKEVKAYVAKEDITAGTQLTLDNVYELTGLSEQNSSYYMTKDDLGSRALIDIKKGTWVIKEMVIKDYIADNLREVEYSTFFIGNNISQNDYFDLHIQYPNGEDYVVLSKTLARKIDTANQCLYLWITPDELLNVSGAIVDCYLNQGSRLYSVKYIEPTIQEASILTYTPNEDIIQLMKRDPNIVNIAVKYLSSQTRLSLEERLHLFYNKYDSSNQDTSIYYPNTITSSGEIASYTESNSTDSVTNYQTSRSTYEYKDEVLNENNEAVTEEEVYYVD